MKMSRLEGKLIDAGQKKMMCLEVFRKKLTSVLASTTMMSLLTSCAYIKQEDHLEQMSLLESMKEVAAENLAQNKEAREDVSNVLAQQASINEQVTQLQTDIAALKKEIAKEGVRSSLSDLQNEKQANSEASSALGEKSVVGRVEWLWLPDAKRYFASQVNTALDESIIYADDIVRFEREGKPWLRFTVERNDWSTEIEARVSGHKRFSYPASTQVVKTPVVSIPIALSDYNNTIEFLVIERKKTYPQFAMGRNFLTDIAVVDVSQKYLLGRDAGRIKLESAEEKQYLAKKEKRSNLATRARSNSQVSSENE